MDLRGRINQLLLIARDYLARKRYDSSIECLDRILELMPVNPEALRLRAEVYYRLADYNTMEEWLLQSLNAYLDNIDLLVLLWDCYFRQKKYQNVLDDVTTFLEKNPKNLHALTVYGVTLMEVDKLEEAITVLERVEDREHLPTIRALANAYFKLNKWHEAQEHYSKVHKLNPGDAFVLSRLCFLMIVLFEDCAKDYITRANQLAKELLDAARGDMHVTQYIQRISSISIDLDLEAKLGDKKKLWDFWANNGLNKLFVLHKSRVKTMQDRLDLLEAHRVWGMKVEANVDNKIKRRVRQRLSNKIRLGVFSADFRGNHVGCYIWPLIENLNRDKFEIYCYSQWPDKNDNLQQKFKNIVDDFKEYPLSLDDKSVAQSIADDCVDVLVETGGWAIRPEVIASKPASLQISWLDYAHSMGLPTAVDYVVVDPYIIPESPKLLIEKPLVLPETWIVMHQYGFADVPILKTTPQERNGYITFGVMNAPYRLVEEEFKVWAGIMKMVPNSRLLYIRQETVVAVTQDNFCKYMEKYGISRDRISFIAKRNGFMEHYNEVDIALDTFPHMGATTTGYTIWMGVPLVSLVGPCFFERLSYSALNNCGLGDLCAFSLREYHDIAMQLVADKERRKYIRNNLRSWILNGPLWQPQRFADNMGNAVADVLGKW